MSARIGDVLLAELSKIRTLPAVWLALGIATAINLAIGIVIATDAVRLAGSAGTTPIAQLGTVILAPVYAFAAIPVFAGGSEYRGGQLRVTLAVTPQRGVLFGAKLAATAICCVAAAIVALLPGFLVRDGGGAARLLLWVVVYLAVGLIGFACAILVKGVVAPLAVLLLLPVATQLLRATLPQVVKFLPHEAGLSLLGIPATRDTALAPGVAMIVLAVWVACLLVLAQLTLTRRDS